MSDPETPKNPVPGNTPEPTDEKQEHPPAAKPEAASSQPQQGAPEQKPPEQKAPDQENSSSGIAAAAASAGASLNLGAQQQQTPQQTPQQPPQQPAPQQPQQQAATPPQQPAQQQPAPQQPDEAAGQPAATPPAATPPAATQAAATQAAATQAAPAQATPPPGAAVAAEHHTGEMALEGEDEVMLPDDGSAITFRREDRRAHSYFYVSLTFMVMMVISLFANNPTKTYLMMFPGWFVIVYFVMDAIEMETAKLRLDLRRIQLVRWRHALTIPMCKITDVDIWPKHSRNKTGLDIYYTESGKELRERIRIQDFRDFDVIVELVKQGANKKVEFALDEKQRRQNKKSRAKSYDKLILAGIGCLVLGALHLQLLFGLAEYFRGIF